MGVDTSDVNIEIEGGDNDEKDDAEMNDEPSNTHAAILGRIQEIEFETKMIKAIRKACK